LTQISEGEDRYRVEIALEGDGLPRQTAVSEFDFPLSAQDREDLRWYFEDYLQYLHDPAPKRADRIEKRMEKIGVELFRDIFQADEDTRGLWAEALRTSLSEVRIEVVTEVREAASIPWELIRDPKTDAPLALAAKAFVRAYHRAAQRPKLPEKSPGPIRILLVICRPRGRDDVPFRSVASRIVKGLTQETLSIKLDVLRPPTFEQLSRVLHEAKSKGQPYHVVHFDGHGTYAEVDPSDELGRIVSGLSRVMLAGSRRPGPHGYLLFENPSVKENAQFVDGPSLGNLLVETDVPFLILNACRSAHAEPPNAPLSPEEAEKKNVHENVRAFGSLALEVMDAGVVGVVAMRYNVYVVTAVRFVEDLYHNLVRGQTLEEAVTLGRKLLHDQPQRDIGYKPHIFQDWTVPIVYSAAPVSIFPELKEVDTLLINTESADSASERAMLDPAVPPIPDVGFFGMDGTLLALDRVFDSQKIVLLHAFAGSGKTSAAAEFARWYSSTGGVNGPVLFSTFERYKPLARVLDKIEQFFGKALERSDIHWLTLTDVQRRDVALKILKRVPVLWIWDNVEPVAGFPSGTKSAWSLEEQKDLVDFLRDARDTKAKFLLTSRRDESGWLGDLPARIQVTPMLMQEGVELARAVAERRGRRFMDVEDWTPLLRFSQGNPLTITVLVGQALRNGLETKTDIEGFVAELQAGTAEIEEDEREGRSKSLGASLRYGFEHAFDEEELKRLALLHLFQGFVNVDVLKAMGNPDAELSLPEVRGLTRDYWISLLDRTAEVGLLRTRGGGYYFIQPALPWFFKNLFEEHHSSDKGATRAFVEAVGSMGNYYFDKYQTGHREVVLILAAEEANLLYARQLATKNGWWRTIIAAMQGLRWLYDQTGWWVEWKRLVDEITPLFMDPKTDSPILGREMDWNVVIDYRVKMAIKSRQWVEAMRLEKKDVERQRLKVGSVLAVDQNTINEDAMVAIRNYVVSIGDLAGIQYKMGDVECIQSYEEAIEKSEMYGFWSMAAGYSMNLGNAYVFITEIRALHKAEHFFKRGLDLTPKSDVLGRSRCLANLGNVALERYLETLRAGKPECEHLWGARKYYQLALDILPPNAVEELALTHNRLGCVYEYSGMFNESLRHHQESIRYSDKLDDLYLAATRRRDVAILLRDAGQLSDALEYARSAREKFEAHGPVGAERVRQTQNLIVELENALRSK